MFPGQPTLPVITAICRQKRLCWDRGSSAGERNAQKEGLGTAGMCRKNGWHPGAVTCALAALSRGGILPYMTKGSSKVWKAIGREHLKLPWTWEVSENSDEHLNRL